jgi:transposase
VHEDVLERAAKRLRRNPEVMNARRSLVQHPFGTLKSWTSSNHFLTRRLSGVSTETSLQILAYRIKQAINPVGTRKIMEAIAP